MPTSADPGFGGENKALTPVAEELLDELFRALALLTARLAVVERDYGRTPLALAELAEAREEVGELQALLREIRAEQSAPPGAAHGTFVPVLELERTVDRWFRGSATLPVELRTTVDADARVAGPRALFTHAVSALLRRAARQATSRLLVSLDAGEAPGDPLVLVIEGDGPPPLDGDVPPSAGGAAVFPFLTWAAGRMEGTLEQVHPSETLGGAGFLLSLPLLRRSRGAARRRSWLPEASGSARERSVASAPTRIAVVDDDEAICRVLVRRLARSGFEAVACSPLPEDTAATLATRLGAADFDVALIDLNLGTLSGAEVATTLRARRAGAGILLMTGGEVPEATSAFRHVHKLDAWERICETLREAARP